MTPKTFFALLIFFAGSAGAAPSAQKFNRDREEIQILTLERMRSAPNDARALVTGEKQLRLLFESFQVDRGTPPVSLDGLVKQLRTEGHTLLRLRSAGRLPPPAPRAAALIQQRWDVFNAQFEALQESIVTEHEQGKTESGVYWATLRAFDTLTETTDYGDVHNPPPGEKNTPAYIARLRGQLLKQLERDPKKTRAPGRTPIALASHTAPPSLDVSSFFRFVDRLPDKRPLSQGVWSLPVGTRSLTERRSGVRLIIRPVAGRGVLYAGQSEVDLDYGHKGIPADTAFYFENTGDIPLDIQFVGIEP